MRSWLYRIASNVCFDMLKGRKRRALPMDLMDVGHADGAVDPPTTGEHVGRADARPAASCRTRDDPAEEAEIRESVRLAFVAALQHLPPRQRAVLILREVLKWKASEVAELLDTTVVSVNSALQRARSTLADRNVTVPSTRRSPIDAEQQELLARYVDAFERFDIESLVSLLHEDATMPMPPYPLWMQRRGRVPRLAARSRQRVRGIAPAPIDVNGAPAFAQWRVDPDGGLHRVVDSRADDLRRRHHRDGLLRRPRTCSRSSTCPSTSTPESRITGTAADHEHVGEPGERRSGRRARARVAQLDRRARAGGRPAAGAPARRARAVRIGDAADVAADDVGSGRVGSTTESRPTRRVGSHR